VALGKVPRLQQAHASLIVVPRKTLPSPSNAWLSKLLADLAALCESVIVALPRPVLKVGPSSLSVILDLSGSAPRVAETTFIAPIYSRGWCDLFLPLTIVFAFSMPTVSYARCCCILLHSPVCLQ
jgi:hypothetical protein